MRIAKIFIVSLSLFLAGCATNPKNIAPAYVSPLQYQAYNCEQLGQELARVANQASAVSDAQDSVATKDAAAMGVGLILFWPALFFLASGSDQEHEVARLKGTLNAVEDAAIKRKCSSVLASVREGKQALFDDAKGGEATKSANSECKYPAVHISCVNGKSDSPHIDCSC